MSHSNDPAHTDEFPAINDEDIRTFAQLQYKIELNSRLTNASLATLRGEVAQLRVDMNARETSSDSIRKDLNTHEKSDAAYFTRFDRDFKWILWCLTGLFLLSLTNTILGTIMPKLHS